MITQELKNDFLKAFGKQVKHLRKKNNMTQAELANICKTDAKMVSRVENGRHNIKLTSLLVLFGAFGISLEELFDFDEFRHLILRLNPEKNAYRDKIK